MPIPDFLGLDGLLKATHDTSSSDSLKARPSRQFCLFSLLKNNAISGWPELRIEIADFLQESIERLGPYSDHAGRLDPAFMAVHALNLLNPANWRTDTSNLGSDSKPIYIPPLEEAEHLARLSASTSPSLADQDMQFAVRAAVLHPNHSSSEFAVQAVDWARRPAPPPLDDGWHKPDFRDLAIISAAVIAMRDGDEVFRAQQRVWARSVFLAALNDQASTIVVPETTVQFNPVAMAFIGTVYLIQGGVERGDVRLLLEGATRRDLLAASGFRVSAELLASVDERLPRALLRAALASCISPRRRRGWSGDEGEGTLDIGQRTRSAIEGELAWLFDEDDEPEWPEFPKVSPVRDHGLRISFDLRGMSAIADRTEILPQPNEYVDEGSAALWLRGVSSLLDVKTRPWLLDVARAYAEWTAAANGSQLRPRDRIKRAPWEWNAAYYDLVARCLPGLGAESIDLLVLDPIRSLPDQSFFDAVSRFLRSVDEVYFGTNGLAESEAVRIRAILAERLSGSPDWKWRASSPSTSIERNLGTAVATFFFNNWNWIPLTSCYLPPSGVARIGPFLPVLERLVAEGLGGFVAGLVLALLEVSPNSAQLSFIVATAEAWLTEHPHDTSFWIDVGTAERFCAVIDNVRAQEAPWHWDPTLRERVSNILSGLVGIGVPMAAQLEQDLAAAAED